MTRTTRTPALQPALLVTGATGFLGSHFVYRALRSGVEVVAVARGESTAAARERVLAAVAEAAASYCEAFDVSRAPLQVLRGDITLPQLGIDERERAALRGRVRDVWHVAASLRFEDRFADEIRLHNVTGTANCIDLACQLGAARFVYLSTAYTAGRRLGEIEERPHPADVIHNNHYERSKAEAERLVVDRCAEAGLDACILRPSIIVGPHRTKRTGGSDSGLYGFFRELRRLADVLGQSGDRIGIRGEPDTPANLVPVDDVVAGMLDVLAGGGDRALEIVHLTSAATISVGDVIETTCEVAGVPPFEVLPDHEPRTPLERLVERRMTFYRSYFRDAKLFLRARSGGQRVSRSDVRQYLNQAALERRGEVIDAVLRRGALKTPDGLELVSFAGGEPTNGTVVLVNAFGMPADFFLPMARALARDFRVLSWESRCVPGGSDAFSPEQGLLARHVDDLRALLLAHGVEERVHLVGWCSGAHVAHRFARLHPDAVASMALMNGSYYLDAAETTPFQDNVRTVMPLIARGLEYAEFYHATIYGREGSGGSGETAQLNVLLDGVDPSLIHMTRLPFQSPESLFRYAVMVADLLEHGEERHAHPLPTPCLVLGGSRDHVAHFDGSRLFAERSKAERFVLIEGGDHYSFHFDASVTEAVRDFLGAVGRGV